MARLSILIVFLSRFEISDRERFTIDRDYFPEDRELFPEIWNILLYKLSLSFDYQLRVYSTWITF